MAGYWAEALGGPPLYSQSCGGHSAMLHIHAGPNAERELGDRFVECFVSAADDAGLPDDPEFRSGLRSYMEWAVREVLTYAPQGAAVPADLTIPRWSWAGLETEPG
ncbi:MAG: hypothetical protein M3063_07980 [Actinomycetota bacterium]|nr:hypothetical protein [Actinomycetota bacterium]